MKTNLKKRMPLILTVLLAVAVMIGLAPQIGEQAYAEGEDPATDASYDAALILTLAPDSSRPLTETCSADFNVELWTEEDGVRTPLAGESLTFSDGSPESDEQTLVLDSDGKGAISVQMQDSAVTKVIQVPENCFYKVTMTNNTPDASVLEYSGTDVTEATGQVVNSASVTWYARGPIRVPLTVVLNPIDCPETCSADFNLELWTEEDETKIPLAGETLEIVSGSIVSGEQAITLDSDGKATFALQIEGSYKSVTFLISVWDRENCYYRMTAANNTPDNALIGYSSGGVNEITGKASNASLVWYALGKLPVTIVKEDQNGNRVTGAKLEIRDKDGEVLDSWTSGSEDHVTKLPISITFNDSAKYTLTETSTPDGYMTAADIEFKWYSAGAVPTGSTQSIGDEIHMLDVIKGGDLTINAVYDDNGTNAILKSSEKYAIQVLIDKLPLVCKTHGLDIEDAYVYNYGAGHYMAFGAWLGNGTGCVTDTTISKLDSSYFIQNAQDKCYTNFIVWLKPGETFTMHGVPQGATYRVQKAADSLTPNPPDNQYRLLDISYEGDANSGTCTDANISTTVKNTLRTVDLKLSKTIFGYDSGRPVYIGTQLKIYNTYYESAKLPFTDCDGVERTLSDCMIGNVQYTAGPIPLHGDGKETVIKLPFNIATSWAFVENIFKTGIATDQYTYEEVAEAFGSSLTASMFSQGGEIATGYENIGNAWFNGNTLTNEAFDLRYKNASRLIAFQKVDENGAAVAGAHMQILNKETGDVICDWTSDKKYPFEVNTGDRPTYGDSWYAGTTFVLHEVEPPAGYLPAEDIEFTVKKHTGTTEVYDAHGAKTGDANYYYPYIDTGDGEETLILKMVNAIDPETQMGTDGTPVGPGASAVAAEKAITGMTSDTDPAGSVFSKLNFKSKKQSKNSVKLNWSKPGNAKSFVIYGNKCGKGIKPVKIATSTGTALTVKTISGKKLAKGTYYKFIIVALDSNNKVVSTSKLIHVATSGGKVGNHKKVTVKKAITKKAKKLKKGKTLKLKAKAVKKSKKVKKHVGVRYESTNAKIATVSAKGVVKGTSKGTCYVYAYAQNGVFKKIKITVK